ncbi:MAG: SEC-C domain-containing protein [Paludibacteraceae bacterium]|nr:SEC-C domain-containing protein [Paludibacteraceae bacterium]
MGERIGIDIVNMIYDGIAALVDSHYDSADAENLRLALMRQFAVDIALTEEMMRKTKIQELTDQIYDKIYESFSRKSERTAQIAYPVIKNVYEKQGQMYERIIIPFTDGKMMYNIPVNLKEAYETEGKAVVKEFQKAVLLHTIDEAWKEHLRDLDDLRTSVQNAQYEQKDPLVIYKIEAHGLFMSMIETINQKAITILMRGQIPVREGDAVQEAREQKREDPSRYQTSRSDIMRAGQQDTREQQKTQPIRAEKTVGRNDPCPCGSGKKYKNCCGRGV